MIRPTRALLLAFNAWTATNKRAANDYADHPTAFNDRDTCSKCAGPIAAGGCDTCRNTRNCRLSRARRGAA